MVLVIFPNVKRGMFKLIDKNNIQYFLLRDYTYITIEFFPRHQSNIGDFEAILEPKTLDTYKLRLIC